MSKNKFEEGVLADSYAENVEIHPAAWFRSVFFLVSLLAVFYFFSNGYINSVGDFDLLLLNLAILAINIIMFNMLSILIKIKTTRYYVGKRDGFWVIGGVSGFWLFKREFSAEIGTGVSILVEQGWLGRILGFGNISIYNNTMLTLELKFIKNPSDIVRKIRHGV